MSKKIRSHHNYEIQPKSKLTLIGNANCSNIKLKHQFTSSSTKQLIKLLKKNNEIHFIDERYTTKTCNNCNKISTYLMKRTLTKKEMFEKFFKKNQL